MSEATTVLHELTRRFGPIGGLVAASILDRAAHTVGSVAYSAGDGARTWGVSPASVRRALAKLEACGFIVKVREGGLDGGKTHWRLGHGLGLYDVRGVSKMHTPNRGAYKKDFKGVSKMHTPSESDLRVGLAGWLTLPGDVDAVLAEYPAAWVAAKLAACEGRKVAPHRRHGYLQAALQSWHDPAERERVRRQLLDEAERMRRASDRRTAERQRQRARDLAALHARSLEATALAWWRGLDEAGQTELARAYRNDPANEMTFSVFGDMHVFDPEASAVCAAWLVERWESAWRGGDDWRSETCASGIDVQRDGRRYCVVVLMLADGMLVLDGRSVAESWADVPMARRVLVDEGDGMTTTAVREFVTDLQSRGHDVRSWKGGTVASGGELIANGSFEHGVHGDEGYWAGVALGLLSDPSRLIVTPALLADDGLWHGLAGRLDVETRGVDDHFFDALKLAVAAALGAVTCERVTDNTKERDDG